MTKQWSQFGCGYLQTGA